MAHRTGKDRLTFCLFTTPLKELVAAELTLFYTVNTPGTLQIRLLNVNNGAISTLLPATEVEPGEYQLSQESGAIASGIYSVQMLFNSQLFAKTIIKP